jgi:hypothetical protein
MRRITTILLAFSVAGAGLWGTNRALAGQKSSDTVTIASFPGGTYAVGQIGATRASADRTQMIGCWMRQYLSTSTTPVEIQCTARDAAGTFLACSSADTRLRDIVQALSGDSRMGFGADSAGNCMYLFVDNNSKYSPKQP